MSSDVAIRAVGVCKEFKKLERPLHQLLNAFALESLADIPRKKVLKGLDFEIKQGEKVGILGVNGAGKSTLLQMMAGMSKPTSGVLEVNGRLGAILELGAGFHPELSGRQNAETILRLNGFSHHSIPALMHHIEEFSGLAQDMDSKTRTYSSGMLVRLAFATATCGEPDLFIVDEALAVGDAAFQQKCYKYLRETLAKATLILISHDMTAISALCDRVMIIDGGLLVFDGNPVDAIPVYNKIVGGNCVGEDKLDANGLIPDAAKSGIRDLDIRKASVFVNGTQTAGVFPGAMVTVEMLVDDRADVGPFEAAMGVTDIRGQYVFGQSVNIVPDAGSKSTKVSASFRWPAVAAGHYSVNIEVLSGSRGLHASQCNVHGIAVLQATLNERAHGIFNIELESVASHSA
jgi:lipopolysaccharide transport system ATP-binding protein